MRCLQFGRFALAPSHAAPVSDGPIVILDTHNEGLFMRGSRTASDMLVYLAGAPRGEN